MGGGGGGAGGHLPTPLFEWGGGGGMAPTISQCTGMAPEYNVS